MTTLPTSTGSHPTLGSWNPALALPLSASRYSLANPVWFVTVPLPPGAVVEYKFLRVSSSGSVMWEGGWNRKLGVECVEAVVKGVWP